MTKEKRLSSVMRELAKRRWDKATDEERKRHGQMLAEARKKRVARG